MHHWSTVGGHVSLEYCRGSSCIIGSSLYSGSLVGWSSLVGGGAITCRGPSLVVLDVIVLGYWMSLFWGIGCSRTCIG